MKRKTRKRASFGILVYLCSVLTNEVVYGIESSRALAESNDPYITQESREDLIQYHERNIRNLTSISALIPGSFIWETKEKPRKFYFIEYPPIDIYLSLPDNPHNLIPI